MSHPTAHEIEEYRQLHERYIYVIEFASRTVKVGQTKNATVRLADHVKSATTHSDSVTRSWFSGPHLDYRENERHLIAFCAQRWKLTVGTEFFRDADFDEVLAHAQGLPYRRLTQAEIIEAVRASILHREAVRAEFDARAELTARLRATDSAKQRLELVASLANDDNRPEASAATYEIVKDLFSREPSPWAISDPTAAQRYLVACGASVEAAQRTAPEFELGMRALYAMSCGQEAEFFDDIARFCAPLMTGEAR